jgi:hypothetical protein
MGPVSGLDGVRLADRRVAGERNDRASSHPYGIVGQAVRRKRKINQVSVTHSSPYYAAKALKNTLTFRGT